MLCEQRLCPSVGGRCGAFLSPLFRDLHPTCVRCRDTKCSADVTCDIYKDWSVAQWEAFLKKRPYSGHHKIHPSGSALPTAPPTLPPSASVSSEAGCPAPPHRPPIPPSEGHGCWGGCPPRGFSWGLLFPLLPFGGRGGGGGGASELAASSLPGVGVAGSARSWESLVLASFPVASSVSAGRDRQSRSHEIVESTGDSSCSSRSSPSRGQDSREGHRCAGSRSGGVAWPVSRVTLSFHGLFAVLWTKAFSLWLVTLPFCLCAVSLVLVAVFRLLPVPSGSLSLLEWPFMVSTVALAFVWLSRGLAWLVAVTRVLLPVAWPVTVTWPSAPFFWLFAA